MFEKCHNLMCTVSEKFVQMEKLLDILHSLASPFIFARTILSIHTAIELL